MSSSTGGFTSGVPDVATIAGMNAMTKADLAYLRLRHEIIEGELEPGSAIDQESLAARLGVSTTPLREALRRLESERLVISRAHRDTVVAPLRADILLEVYAVRLSLDPLAVELAAKNATDEQLAEMKRSFEHHGERTPADHLHRNRHVHRAVYQACGNSILIETLDRLWDLSDRYRMLSLSTESVVSHAEDEHHAIVEAVLARDGARAHRLMYEHVALSFEKIRSDERLKQLEPPS